MLMVEEVKTLFIFSVLIVLIFMIFIVAVVLLYRRRQSEVLLKSQLEEEKHNCLMISTCLRPLASCNTSLGLIFFSGIF